MARRLNPKSLEGTAGKALSLVTTDAKPVETAPKPRRARKAAPQRAPAAPISGRYITMPVRFTPEQRRALVQEATRRMVERDAGRPDASEVLREILDAWLEER